MHKNTKDTHTLTSTHIHVRRATKKHKTDRNIFATSLNSPHTIVKVCVCVYSWCLLLNYPKSNLRVPTQSHVHTHTNTCTRIHTYIEVTYTDTQKQSLDSRNDAWRESADMTRVFARRSKHREVCTAQGTFVNWNHRSGSATSEAAHENERAAECKFAEESNIRSRARSLTLPSTCVCVCVCMPGQARGAQRASINMFAAWPQRVECLRRLLYVQHAAMCNMSQWRRHRCCCRPLPSLHTSPFFSTVSTNKQRP